MLDIMMSFAIQFHFKWVSKAEASKIPFIGWNMKFNNYVGIQRGNRSDIKKMMEKCTQHLQNNNSLYLFSEGTRSKTVVLGKFKQVAFSLAKKQSNRHCTYCYKEHQ